MFLFWEGFWFSIESVLSIVDIRGVFRVRKGS